MVSTQKASALSSRSASNGFQEKEAEVEHYEGG